MAAEASLRDMEARDAGSRNNTPPRIIYLSRPAQVSMGDAWFEIASIEHFWVCRRFNVLHRLAGDLAASAREMADVGCGHGLLQWQIENAYGKKVAGFDLNEFALENNQSSQSEIYCYDIAQKAPALRERFDLIFLFDVLEHIEDEDAFLAALLFHLSAGGKIILNVPAGRWAYSAYDRAAGHVRRYSHRSLRNTAARNGLQLARWSYWGFPLIPVLLARRLWLARIHDRGRIISEGFASRTKTMNYWLGVISRFELIPQRVLGTSLMAVIERARGPLL